MIIESMSETIPSTRDITKSTIIVGNCITYAINENDTTKKVGFCYTKDNIIKNLVVLPEYRNKGIATELLKYAECKIKKNYNYSELTPEDNDENLVDFYKKHGYTRIISENDKSYDETDKDCWRMHKKLI